MNCPQGKRGRPGAGAELVEAERGLIAKHNDSSPLSVAFGDSRPRVPSLALRAICTSQQILDTNHKKIYNKKLSVSQISVRNATCDIELASDSLTNKLDAVH